MKNDGKFFEKLLSELITIMSASNRYTSVDGPRVFLEGHDGEREFDIVLRSKVCGFDLLTVVECRDHSTKLDVTHVDAFHSKLSDVRANKGVIVSPVGFTATAVSKAKRLGISLLTCFQGERFSDSVIEVGLDVPFIVTEIDINAALGGGAINFEHETVVADDQWYYLNGRPLYQYVAEALSKVPDTDINLKEDSVLCLRGAATKDWILDKFNKRIYISDPDITFQVNAMRHYFGYLSGIKDAKVISDVISGERTLFLNPLEFLSGAYHSKFTMFETVSDVPKVGAARMRIYNPCHYALPDFVQGLK